jgi:hypothetical protein
MLRDSGREIFPPPGQTPGFVQSTGSHQQSGFPDQHQEVTLPRVHSPSGFAKIPAIAWVGIIGMIIVFLVLYTNVSATSGGSTHLPVTPQPTRATTVRITTLPTTITTIPQTSSAALLDPQNGMKVYTNQQYKYTIDYPVAWNVNKDGSSVSFSPYHGPVLEITPAQKSGSLQDYFLSQSLKIQANPEADITNHDFKCTLGYRIDYVIKQEDTIISTKVTEIFTEGQPTSQVFIISYRGTDTSYDAYSGDFSDMVRTFRLIH